MAIKKNIPVIKKGTVQYNLNFGELPASLKLERLLRRSSYIIKYLAPMKKEKSGRLFPFLI
jgi:hypothetical protein